MLEREEDLVVCKYGGGRKNWDISGGNNELVAIPPVARIPHFTSNG